MIHLGIDFDDTLLDTRRVFLAILNRAFGTQHTYASAQQYYLDSTFGCTSADLERIFSENFDELHNLDPLPGAADMLLRAHAQGHRLTLITARPPIHMPPLHEWVARHHLPMDTIISAPKSGEKALRAAELGIDLFIDDNPRHALAIADKQIPVLLLDRPYNQTCAGPRITRVPDWHAVASVLFAPGHITQVPSPINSIDPFNSFNPANT